MCVKMLNPQEHETVIDTACGSAGFTVHTMFYVWRKIIADMGLQESHLFTMDAKPARCEDYVQDKVFAIDFDEKSVRVARCLNLIAGDGETNVLHLNTLDWTKWDETVKQDDWNDTYGEGWRKLRKLRATARQPDYRLFKFDVLMANPPFAGDIKQSDMLSPYDLAHKKDHKLERAVGRDLLFIERNLDFLKPGGRMAVVLPQGRFNNSSDQRVREFIMERCRILAVVGLHPNTFKPHTGTKTSVLFVQKWNDNSAAGPMCPKVDNYNIFFATQQVESVNNSGEKVYVRRNDGSLMRDMHGHFMVAHDLFNHDGLTKDGVTEAFQEFAAGEQLSFFPLRPFDSVRLSGLLKGLEASILPFSIVKEDNRDIRIDSPYFAQAALEADALVARRTPQAIHEVASDVRSFGAYALTNEFQYQDEGIPFLRGANYSGDFINFGDVLRIAPGAHKLLHKSEVMPGMVLLSMSGSVGNVAVALDSWDYPINSNQDIAKIVPSRDISPFYLASFLSSTFGKIQLNRLPVGSVQQHVFLWMIERIQVPRFKSEFEKRVSYVVKRAYETNETVSQYFGRAENALLAALGLADWTPPEPLSYTARSDAASNAGRIDAQYFMPAKEQVRQSLAALPGQPLGARMHSIRDMFTPDRAPATMRVRNYDVTDALVPLLDAEKEPSFAAEVGSLKKTFKNGDLVISRLRAYLKEIAVVQINDDIHSVGSSEFIVLRPKKGQRHISPETLLIFLRSSPVQTILKWCQDGSQHPRFSESDLLSIPVPDAVVQVSSRIAGIVQQGFAAHYEARQLLDAAKRAVEIAIEGGEDPAIAFLAKAERIGS